MDIAEASAEACRGAKPLGLRLDTGAPVMDLRDSLSGDTEPGSIPLTVYCPERLAALARL